MFVLGKTVESVTLSARDEGRSETDPSTIDEQKSSMDIGPTILFCNPNAGIYEFMYFEVTQETKPP